MICSNEPRPSSPRRPRPGDGLPVDLCREGQNAISVACRCSASGAPATTPGREPGTVGPGARGRVADRADPGDPRRQSRGVRRRRGSRSDLVLDDGDRIGRKRVERLMRQAGLSGLISRNARAHDDPRARRQGRGRSPRPQLRPGAPNRCWVADITYLRTWEGLALPRRRPGPYSRRIVGWAMADHMRAELVTDALQMALAHRTPARGPDLALRPRQPIRQSRASARRPAPPGSPSSMGSKGDCFDNAVAESFFATLKKELINRRSWPLEGRAHAPRSSTTSRSSTTARRRHSTLGMLSPTQFEKETLSNNNPN